jgi:hypothetical protein
MLARVLASVGALVTVSGQGAPAHALPAPGLPLRLTVTAAFGCPDGATLLSQVKDYAPRVRAALPGESATAIQIEVHPSGPLLEGIVTVEDPGGASGRRELQGANCDSLASAAAFVIAVIMDPQAARAREQAPASPSPALSALTTAPPSKPPPPPPSKPPPPIGQLSAGTALEIAHGFGPDPAVIARLLIDFAFSRWLTGVSLRLEGGRGLEHSVHVGAGTATIGATDARIEPCFDVWSPRALEMRGCGVVEMLFLSADSEAGDPATSQSPTLASLELGLAVRPTWTIGKYFSVGLLAGAAVPLARYRFYFTLPDTTVYRLPALSTFGELSAEVNF